MENHLSSMILSFGACDRVRCILRCLNQDCILASMSCTQSLNSRFLEET